MRYLEKETVPCYVFENLTDEQEARLSQLDNDLDETHKKEHFLDVAEAYKRLESKHRNVWIAVQYYGDKKHENRVRQLLKIAEMPQLAKDIIRGDNSQKVLIFLRIENRKAFASNSQNFANYFKEGHFQEITKLRSRRIIQICKEIVEHKGDWKHSQIKRRVNELLTIDAGKRIVWKLQDKKGRRKLWREVERGYHKNLEELQQLVDKLNAEYSQITLYNKDFFDITEDEVPDGSIDLIYVDPPYGLSGGGITYHSGKIKGVNKGEWDKKAPEIDAWVKICVKKLKPNGSIYVSGTYHNIYDVALSLRKNGLKIRNEIIWIKTVASPTIIPKYYAFWHETVLFATKGDDYFFDAEQIKKYADGKQVRDYWNIPPPQGKERVDHSTQKPLALLERIITASCPQDGIILDPFVGSGTTLVVAKKLRRKCVGYEKELEYIEIANMRIR